MKTIHPRLNALRFGGSSFSWYILLVFLAAFIAILSMGGGLWSLSPDHLYHELSHTAFAQLCHQQAGRSLELNGLAMAVCSRCFGIYSSFSIALILLPILILLGLRYQHTWAIRFIVVSIMAIGIDFVGNLFGFWINTHLSRIILGSSLGISLAWLLAGQIKLSKIIQSYE